MPQKHVLSGFESRVGYQLFEIGDSHQFHCSFTTWMWQRRPRRAATDLRRSPTRRAAGWRGSRRLMVRTAALQAAYAGSSPAGNASTHLAVARHGKRTWFGTTKPQVRILPARPTDAPVAQWIKRARGYDPRGRGFDSLPGCQSWRRISEERVPACRAGVRGFKSRRRRQRFAARLLARRTHMFRRVAQQRESSRLLTGRLQVQLLPRRPMNARLAQSKSARLTSGRSMARSHHRVPIRFSS